MNGTRRLSAAKLWGIQFAMFSFLAASCRSQLDESVTTARPGTANVYAYTYLCELGTPGYTTYCDDPSSVGDQGTPYEAYWGCPATMAQWQCDFIQAAMNRLKASGISYCVNSAAAVQALWDANTVKYNPTHRYQDDGSEIGGQTFWTDSTMTWGHWVGDTQVIDSTKVISTRVDSIVFYAGTFGSGQNTSGMGTTITMTGHEGTHAIDPHNNTDTGGLGGGANAVGAACQAGVDNTPPVTGGGDNLRQDNLVTIRRGWSQ
jgi:hypothetical protein